MGAVAEELTFELILFNSCIQSLPDGLQPNGDGLYLRAGPGATKQLCTGAVRGDFCAHDNSANRSE